MKHVVDCENVTVQFMRYREKNRMLRWTLLNMLRKRQPNERFYALNDVSFNIRPGETFGIVGVNGSGKSTLLKLITGIMRPDSGSIHVRGRVSALLELGAGFHPDLTGTENVFLNGSIMGLTRAEIRSRFKEIVRFSELADFIDTPIKYYSSGMYMRLGFSIAINVDPDILVIDEVLAVGDQAFQSKCLNRIRDFKRKGKTIIFVSHDLDVTNQLCSRAIWLDSGAVAARGSTQRVMDLYRERMQQTEESRLADDHRAIETEAEQRWGSKDVEISRVEFYDAAGQTTHKYRTGDPFRVKITWKAGSIVERPVFGVGIHRNDGVHINGPNTKFTGDIPEHIGRDGAIWYEIDALNLLPGTYYFSAAVYNYDITNPYDHHEQLYPFMVTPGASDEEYGIVYLPSRWRYEGDHGPVPVR
ncbi:ABC transporter ATP-binding protein [bacterium]|nr:ABC transporter ATP-binding protein [candidate division CSSED10-310 bacterium]